jgi:hypothetical protein
MGEARNVLAIAGVIAGVVGLYVAHSVDRSRVAGSAAEDRDLLPYQKLVNTLDSADQTMFHQIQGALPTLERARAAAGRWPEPAALIAAGVAPFATAEGDETTARAWQFINEGLFVNYLARPSHAGELAWLLLIQEPDPSAPADTAPNYETHHRLPDGAVLHVTVWMRRGAASETTPVLSRPQSSGWTQVAYGVPTPLKR